MAENNTSENKVFIELEYLLNKYYNEHIAKVVSDTQQSVRLRQVQETQSRQDDGWGGYIDAASPFTQTHVKNQMGLWNKKTAEDVLELVEQKLSKDTHISTDMRSLADVYESALKSRLGEARYEELSKRCPSGSLAIDYVNSRINTLLLEQFAKSKVPQSTMQYIMQRGFENSLIGQVFIEAGRMTPETETDKKLKAISERLYNPSEVEKLTAGTVSFATDAVTLGGYGKAATTVGKITKGSLALLDFSGQQLIAHSHDKAADVYTFDELIGPEVFGSAEALAAIRSSTKGVKPAESYLITSMGRDVFHNKVKVPAFRLPFNEEERNIVAEEIRQACGGDASKLHTAARKVLESQHFTPKESSQVPQWMLEKDLAENMRLSTYFLSMATEMKQCHIQKINISGKMMSYDEVAQRGYDYARAAAQQQREEQQLIGQHAQPKAAQQQYVMKQASSQPSQDQGAYVQQAAMPQNVQQQVGVQQPLQAGGDRFSQSMSRGWSDFLTGYGLNGFSDFGQNFGYVLSMLPEMIIGMFTGKAKNFGFRDGLFPLAAIFMGMFVKNPILKMLLIGLGGANLINKAGHLALEHGERAVARSEGRSFNKTYRQYADEVLDSRIQQPGMRGYSLIATIDGVPSVITIDEQTADAYYKGKVPLNTLCNAVLRKYDEQQAAVARNYDRGMGLHEDQEVVQRVIK